MWFELGHHSLVHTWLWMFWRSIFGLSVCLEAVGPGQIVCSAHLDCTVP